MGPWDESVIVAIIQARLGSTRLPRKVARLIAGQTMLARVIERTRQIPEVSEVVVATSEMNEDRWVLDESHRCGVRAFQGPVDNVLARYEGVAGLLALKGSDHIVRVTADCPLLDPVVSHQVIQLAMTSRVDYASNLRDWPDGLDTEVFTCRSIQEAAHFATGPEDREHVTPWMRRNLFCLELPHDPNLRHVKFSVDTEDDLQYVQELYTGLGETFGWEDVLRMTSGSICPWCRDGYPHRRYPLGSIMQKSVHQPMVTVWDMHAQKDGLGILDPDPECLAPELSRRMAGGGTPTWTICSQSLGARIPRSPGDDPVSLPAGSTAPRGPGDSPLDA